jgi:cytoplasmic iron level regulating protein YaaA (DUF328/UPF0246 family)
MTTLKTKQKEFNEFWKARKSKEIKEYLEQVKKSDILNLSGAYRKGYAQGKLAGIKEAENNKILDGGKAYENGRTEQAQADLMDEIKC